MLNWFAVVKWVGIGAVILALLATPVIYLDIKVKAAYAQGQTDGRDEKLAEINELLMKQQEFNTRMTQDELADAQRRNQDAAKLNRKVNDLQKKLQAALNTSSDCPLDVESSRLLRSVAEGSFAASPDSDVPSGPADKVPDEAGSPGR